MRSASFVIVLAAGLLAAEPPAGDELDLILRLDGRSSRIRLHVRIDGRPLAEPWDGYLAALFKHLDRDGDGLLNEKELALAPNDEQVRQQIDGVVTVEPGPAPPLKGRVGPRELADYYRRSRLGPLHVELTARKADDARTTAPFVRLDRDRDDRLTRDEVSLEAFRRLDADDDEVISMRELLHEYTGPGVTSQESTGDPPAAAPLRLADPDEKGRPDLELKASLGREPSGDTARTLGGARLAFLTRCGSKTRTPGRRATDDLFTKADTNEDGTLETSELFRDPFEFVGVLRLADRDDDDRLSRREFDTHLDLHAKLMACATYLTLSDRGRQLDELLDADRDGRLSLREAMTAWERLKEFDADHDGGVTLKELPRQFLVTLSHDQPRPPEATPDPLGYGKALQFGERSRGPAWFRKMDLNRDGDVSRREFLGSPDDFRKLDRDGDGFVTAGEAEAR